MDTAQPQMAAVYTLRRSASCSAVSFHSKLALLPERQRKLLLVPPQKGNGHRELFRDACILRRLGLTAAEQEQVLRARFANYYRDISDRELEDAIASAAGARAAHWPRWPQPKTTLIAQVMQEAGSLQQLRDDSPVKEPGKLDTGEILDRFYQEQDFLCMGRTNKLSETEERIWFRGRESDYQLLVPNAMSAAIGTKRDGSPSKRCLDNSGPWITQVIEFDYGTLDEQASLHLKLRSRGARLRMVVYSGGKSLHGWYDVKDWSADQLMAFRGDAAALGADRMMFTACQFTRTPNALRDNGKSQEVVYLS